MAARPAFSAASCAANGVLLRLPLYPTAPELAQAMTLPSVSVIETIVLLNELLMCTTPVLTFLRSRLRGRRAAVGLAITSSLPSSCWQPCASGPYGCGRWCGCAGHGPADPCGDGCPGGSRSRSCA